MKKPIQHIYLIIFLYCLAANFAHPVTPSFIKQLGLHDYMFGLAFGMMALANFIFSPFWGKMAERFGPGKVLSVALFGYACMQLAFGSSTKEWQICVARFFGGFFISAISVSQIIYVMQNSDQPGHDLAVMNSNSTVVSQFGFLIGGFLGDLSVKWTFLIQAACLCGIGILGMFILKDTEIVEKKPFSVKEINPFADFIACRDLMTTYMTLFLAMTAMTGFGTTAYEQCFNYYIKDVFGFPSSANGIVKAIIGFVCFALNTFVTLKIIRRGHIDRMINYFYVGMVVMLLGVVLIDVFVPFMAVNILFFGVNSIVSTILYNMIAVHGSERGAESAGLFNATRMLGSVAGSFTAGFIYTMGPKISFVVSAVVLSLALVLSLAHYIYGKKQKEVYKNGSL